MTTTREQQLEQALRDFIEWWDEWNDADDPSEIEDPDIEGARALLEAKA